ncbi:acyl transferase/acyl hydrolase/lysophospholipase [Podospora appendiculata]|uniref:Lysophospholipase n=1 Tax=Podospora appendiculata TaxID=314037 RepID=A0AAE0X9V4_9PEZI|nr:acyl transferase/acyl hydrolase/lysophospholipase [Podospora appendiculata]
MARLGQLRLTAFLSRQHHQHGRRSFLLWRPKPEPKRLSFKTPVVITASVLLLLFLSQADGSNFQRRELKPNVRGITDKAQDQSQSQSQAPATDSAGPNEHGEVGEGGDQSAWTDFASSFEGLSSTIQTEGTKLTDTVVELIMPEWTKNIQAYARKLQRELSISPGSLADEIWQEAHDPSINPEINYEAKVRVSNDLCDEEKTFLARRRKVTAVALAKYLDIDEADVHPDDVPVIALSGSGGGLRALVAGTGSYLATVEDGLFDCVTYTSGVSGSCWLQTLFYSSVTGGDMHRAIDHLKARLGVHIADPPTAFSSLISAPTNKYLLSGMVEKLKGDPGADFGLVDAYGMLLAARLLVPKGELEVNERDFKLSNQKDYLQYGQNPMPIYTAVRHEIPELDAAGSPASEEAKDRAKQQSWFQWFEITPYEFFCEEFNAGIPTWAMGRKFNDGSDLPAEEHFRLPELRMPLLMGIWGSAFCATLSHYYREVRPLVKSLSALAHVDDLIWGHNEDLSKVHPIDPAKLPNFAFGMKGKLPDTVPQAIYDNEYLQLMDAGMSNNLPVYPLLRPGRDVDIVVAFDASADIKTDNWLSVVEGYARQRGIKGWPVGIGWPRPAASASTTAKELDQASHGNAEDKLAEAKDYQAARRADGGFSVNEGPPTTPQEKAEETARELGYCTVWVGTTQERSSEPPPPPVDDMTSWKLMEPDAGITVIYLPFLANEKVEGVDPTTSEYMSTWNFVYTPEQIEKVVSLARANYEEGRRSIQNTVRAVYERKKRVRLERERMVKKQELKRLFRLREGDHFS